MIIKKKNTASLLLNPEGKFLLIQRNSKEDSLPGFWELPSGGIDEGENIKTTVIRETREETGIEIAYYKLKEVDSEDYSFQKENGDTKEVNETTFLVILDNTPKVTLSKEHVDYQWATLKDLDTIFEDQEDLIYKRINRIFSKENLS